MRGAKIAVNAPAVWGALAVLRLPRELVIERRGEREGICLNLAGRKASYAGSDRALRRPERGRQGCYRLRFFVNAPYDHRFIVGRRALFGNSWWYGFPVSEVVPSTARGSFTGRAARATLTRRVRPSTRAVARAPRHNRDQLVCRRFAFLGLPRFTAVYDGAAETGDNKEFLGRSPNSSSGSIRAVPAGEAEGAL